MCMNFTKSLAVIPSICEYLPMVLLNKVIRRFYSVISISKTKAMDKCYFRYVVKEDKIDISFLFKVKENARQFNMSRKPTETLENLYTRIEANIRRAVNKKKKKRDEETEKIEVKLFGNKPIPDSTTCKELFSIQEPVKLKIIDNVYETVFNAPWVVSINLPVCILDGFPIYPDHFKLEYADKKQCLYNWYTGSPVNEKGNTLAELHIKWELVGDTFIYTPTSKDVGMKIKLECIPGNGTKYGPPIEVISKNLVEAGPGTCPFETRQLFTSSLLKDKSFRCVSYNILADLYCDSDYTRTVLHPYCPPYALHTDYRKQLLLKEIKGYNADLICLQEVDAKIFNHFLKPIFENEGLDGVFYKKGKEVAEGLACFYRENRFLNIGEESIVLSAALQTEPCLKSIWDSIKDNSPLIKRVLDRSTVASATYLQSKDNPQEIVIVGNTHLYFHPDADHIRLIQGGIVIYWLRDLRFKLKEKFPEKRVSLIVCGDFNSVPSCGIYQLYTTGIAPNDLLDWNSNENEAVKNLSLEQNVLLGSACGTPEFTNFTDGFADCLDYIYYEKSSIVVEQVIPFPSEEELRLHTALPSIVFPSDHIALISDLKFT